MLTRKDLANAVRFLAMDAIQKAGSGHPGAPMGMADMAETLWNDFMVHNPANPGWFNRDRFVLSNGHASMLLYAVLHLTGYDLSLDDLKNFRQLDSKTPGHPEHGLTPGVDATTGPLGQGLATAVGMALAEKILAEKFNKKDFPVIDHYTYVFTGDGCLMEGLSHEACSLAGTLGLNKLIVLWDNNGISIEGSTSGWFRENTPARFEAYGWQVDEVDGQDGEAIKKALSKAKKSPDKPVFISCRTTIGFGAPTKAGSNAVHGSPLGEAEIEGVRKLLGWRNAPFDIPAEIRQKWDARLAGQQAEKKWTKLFNDYAKNYPTQAADLEARMQGELPSAWHAPIITLLEETLKSGGQEATRVSSKKILDVLAPLLPCLIGGSADLSPSVGTKWTGAKEITPEDFSGNYINYGVREFAMGAVMNGLALHGGFIPYAGTFLTFSDYAKPAIRLSALMKLQVIWVLTHDSIGVGEDGPTHQPVEHLASLRMIPGIQVWRPADKIETIAAWEEILRYKHISSCLSLSRQDLPVLSRAKTILLEKDNITKEATDTDLLLFTIQRGGYILREANAEPQAIIIATGSETALAISAAEALEEKKIPVRVVSMPCAEIFDKQPVAWRCKVLPSSIRARVAIEAGNKDWWRKYVGLDGVVIGMPGFGKSAPGKVLFNHYGFIKENIVKTVENLLKPQVTEIK
ncbi:MAG: transketolase [Deltaproteobacteria bacterium]|jgi:transketolase|nr:transketolase [Deltaproteobacteria bacterium]